MKKESRKSIYCLIRHSVLVSQPSIYPTWCSLTWEIIGKFASQHSADLKPFVWDVGHQCQPLLPSHRIELDILMRISVLAWWGRSILHGHCFLVINAALLRTAKCNVDLQFMVTQSHNAWVMHDARWEFTWSGSLFRKNCSHFIIFTWRGTVKTIFSS